MMSILLFRIHLPHISATSSMSTVTNVTSIKNSNVVKALRAFESDYTVRNGIDPEMLSDNPPTIPLEQFSVKVRQHKRKKMRNMRGRAHFDSGRCAGSKLKRCNIVYLKGTGNESTCSVEDYKPMYNDAA